MKGIIIINSLFLWGLLELSSRTVPREPMPDNILSMLQQVCPGSKGILIQYLSPHRNVKSSFFFNLFYILVIKYTLFIYLYNYTKHFL